MTKYKLLKPIKNVEWKVGEVRETEKDFMKNLHIKYNAGVGMYPTELAILEHTGFIEEVNDVQLVIIKEVEGSYFVSGGNGNGRVGGDGGGADVRIIPVGVGDVAVCCGCETLRTFQPLETPKRWRAEKGGDYYHLDTGFRVQAEWDAHGDYDDNHYKAGNYFQTTEQLEEFRKGVKGLVGIK